MCSSFLVQNFLGTYFSLGKWVRTPTRGQGQTFGLQKSFTAGRTLKASRLSLYSRVTFSMHSAWLHAGDSCSRVAFRDSCWFAPVSRPQEPGSQLKEASRTSVCWYTVFGSSTVSWNKLSLNFKPVCMMWGIEQTIKWMIKRIPGCFLTLWLMPLEIVLFCNDLCEVWWHNRRLIHSCIPHYLDIRCRLWGGENLCRRKRLSAPVVSASPHVRECKLVCGIRNRSEKQNCVHSNNTVQREKIIYTLLLLLAMLSWFHCTNDC